MEKLQIGDVIKTLRRNKNLTQEQLANFVGVSTPAVSKWEKGLSYPDILILPKLANYFDVTIDELLNFKKGLSEDEITEIIQECEALLSKQLIDEAIELCEKYIQNYPSNYNLKLKLMTVYTLAYINLSSIEEKEKITNRSIEILNDTIDNTNNIEIKEAALVKLSTQYLILNKLDKAEETLNRIYKPSLNPNVMLPFIYMQQGKIEDSKKLMQENLNNALSEAITSCIGLAVSYYNYKVDMKENELDYDKAYKYYNLSLNISNSTYDGILNHSIYFNLAHLSLKEGKLESCLDYLNKMMINIRKRNINEGLIANNMWCFDMLDNPQINVKTDSYKHMIEALNTEFISLEGRNEYKNILNELKNLREKNNFKIIRG